VNNDPRSEPPWPPDHYQGRPAHADSFDGYQEEQRYDERWPYAGTGQQEEPGWDAFGGNGYRQAGYGEPVRYNQPGPYNQPAQYNQPGPYNEPGRYEEPRGYDEPFRYDEPGLYNEPGQYSEPARGRHQAARYRGGRGANPGVIVGAMMGSLAAAVSIGVATLAAAFFRPQASPIIAVGEAFIDRTPPALKNFAVEKFGENDKTMLLLGMYVTIALLAMAIGVLARKRVAIGVIGVAVFGLFGSFVAYTRPASKPTDVIPSIIGGIAGVFALLWLSHAATAEAGYDEQA
jgi:hypothetical protein